MGCNVATPANYLTPSPPSPPSPPSLSPSPTPPFSPPSPFPHSRVAEVAWEHRGPPPKSLDSDESFMPEHMLFCRELRFVAIYALFLLGKKSAFLGQKQCFLGKKCNLTCYILHIILGKICNYAQKRRFYRGNSKHTLDEHFYGHFALADWLQTSTTLPRCNALTNKYTQGPNIH